MFRRYGGIVTLVGNVDLAFFLHELGKGEREEGGEVFSRVLGFSGLDIQV